MTPSRTPRDQSSEADGLLVRVQPGEQKEATSTPQGEVVSAGGGAVDPGGAVDTAADAESVGVGSWPCEGDALSVGSLEGSDVPLGLVDPVGPWSGSFWSSPPEPCPLTCPIVVSPEPDP